jgi:hypothetical protein
MKTTSQRKPNLKEGFTVIVKTPKQRLPIEMLQRMRSKTFKDKRRKLADKWQSC